MNFYECNGLMANDSAFSSTTVTLDGRYLIISAGDEIKEEHTFYMDVGWKGAITRDIPLNILFPQPGHQQVIIAFLIATYHLQ